MNTNLNGLLMGLSDIRQRQIMLTKFSKDTENIYTNSYVYAICRSVYPMFHEERFLEDDAETFKLNLPFYETYRVSENTISEFAEYLDVNWQNKKYFTFYQIEGHYRNKWSGNELRSDLMNCLRYFYLEELFDDTFWKTILKAGEYPIEASRITNKFNKSELY